MATEILLFEIHWVDAVDGIERPEIRRHQDIYLSCLLFGIICTMAEVNRIREVRMF